jgi:hypothetical protein
MKTLIAAVVLSMSLAGAAFAGPISQREVVQQGRIAAGVRSGELTPRETIRLERGEARIERMRAWDLRDGRIGRIERVRLGRALNRESRQIYRLRHNRYGR